MCRGSVMDAVSIFKNVTLTALKTASKVNLLAPEFYI